MWIGRNHLPTALGLRRASEITVTHGLTHFERLSETNRVDPTRIKCFENPVGAVNLINAREYLRYNFPEALEEFPDLPMEKPKGG